MKHSLTLTLLLFVSLTHVVAEDPTPKLYTIPSWGDFAVVYANGTDPAMDSPQGMENMFRFWKARGFTGVFLRSDLQQYDPFVIRHGKTQMNPALAMMWSHIDKLGERFDYFTAAQQAAQNTGLQFWMYHPHIYSEGAPPHAGSEGPGRMVPWSYESRVLAEHPEMVTVDRRGNKYWMVPEYGYPEVREQKVAEFVYMARKYGIKYFIANMRSEVNQLQDPADHADRFGFNQIVVDDMQRLHDVNIMTDPRFDIDATSFDPQDVMVQKWRDLRGEYLTQFFRELRTALYEVDPDIEIAITLAGEFIGPPLGNWRTDWRTWVDEGLMDHLISRVFFEATLDHEADRKGYLTHSRLGVGTVAHEELKAYISKSKHPGIKVIATGGPAFFFTPTPVPAGADGMQCDAWYGAYHLAWHQRWQNFQRDLREFGHIKFIEQNFDDVRAEEFVLPSGAWGNLAYQPELRACRGAWWRLGTGDDAKPFAQSTTRRGATGQAMQLTHAVDGRDTLTGFHNCSPDRSKWAGAIDTSMTSGHAIFDCWIMRQSVDSTVSAFLQGDNSQMEVGVRIAPGSGKISYSTGTERGTGKWVETPHTVAVGEWTPFHIDVDIDQLRYSAATATTTLCTDVPISPPKQRFVALNGVNIPMEMPALKEFKSVLFTPGGKPGNVTFVDDVTVHWIPATIFAEPGSEVEFSDDFESYDHLAKIDSPALKTKWQQATPATDIVIRDTSFGAGVNSLRLQGGGKVTPLTRATLQAGTRITLDLDFFIRSGEPVPSIMPDTATKFPHSARIGWSDGDGNLIAGVKPENGTWHLINAGGEWIDSKLRVHYDVWNHLQLVLSEDGSLQAAVQPVGQIAAAIGTLPPGNPPEGVTLTPVIEPSVTPDHLSCYDNVIITSGSPAAK